MTKNFLYFLSLIVVLSAILFVSDNPFSKGKSFLKVFLYEQPSSLDPMNFDLSKHHPVQSIFHIKLVTQYRDQKIFPQLAAKWETAASQTRWTFTLRPDIFFSDGQRITPEIAALGLKRAIFMLKKQGSKHEFLRKLSGIEFLTSPSSEISGISYSSESLILKFSEPFPNLLEALSFGIFAIPSPTDFDIATGKWIPTSITSATGAGPYALTATSKEGAIFSKKQNYPIDLIAKNSYPKIEFFSQLENISEADLASLSSENKALRESHSFHGRRAMHILYFSCHGWKLPTSPLFEIQNRKSLQEGMEKIAAGKELKTLNSFFPAVMPGISEVIRTQQQSLQKAQKKPLRVIDLRPTASEITNSALSSLEEAANTLGFEFIPVKGLSQEKMKDQANPNLKKYDFDLGLFATGISIEDPTADARLMFSKEGIWLPDLDGKIEKELDKANLNHQAINQLIYDQSLVWPVAHYSVGTWVSKNLDLEMYNTLLPLGELQWIGSK